MLQATTQNITISADEALFLHCMLVCQSDYGIKPPTELGLPRSIFVVDYDHVKEMMHSKLTLWSANHTAGDKIRHYERTKAALKTARTKLMQSPIVGCHDPFVWIVGAPIVGSSRSF